MTAEPLDGPGAPPGAEAEARGGGSEHTRADHHHAAHTWQEAREAAFDAATPIPPGPVALRIALGRKLDQDIVALQDMPHYASSAMDGWAVNGSGPWIPVDPGNRLAPHQASIIVTGGLIPAGGKAVLRTENAVLAADDEGLPLLMAGG